MWFLDQSFVPEMRTLRRQSEVAQVEGEAYQAHLAEPQMALSVAESDLRILSASGGVATIAVRGLLMPSRSLMTFLLGSRATTYLDIEQAIATVEQDPAITNVRFIVDSPGGSASGMFRCMDRIAAMAKPTEAFVANQAASAAYGLASQAGRITLENDATQVGSVGILTTLMVFEDEVDITSTEAPDKRPDVTTEEGQEVIRDQLDDVHARFVERIAASRGVSVAVVNESFGRGRMLIAERALAAGMVDAITPGRVRLAVETSDETEDSMDLAKLKAEHPGLYAEVFAAGQQAGVTEERERVTAHLELAQAAGDLVPAEGCIAVAAITEGTGLTTAITAKYTAASMRNGERSARSDDAKKADPGTPKAADKTEIDPADAALRAMTGQEPLTA